MRYKYCPECGNKLIDKQAGDDGAVPWCESCHKYWFDTFSSVAIVLVANEHGEIALLRQNYLSEKYWTYVSGYMTPGETAEETAYREVREELGIELEDLTYAGTYWFGQREQLMHGFIGIAKKTELRLSSEVGDAQWIPAEEVPEKLFPDQAGNSQHPIYRRYLQAMKT